MADAMPDIEIDPEHWAIVCDILLRDLADYEVWAFGSRARHAAKRYSDLDLAIMTEQPLPLALYAKVCDAFSESDLPWRVDVIDWASTGESFRNIIVDHHVVIQNPSASEKV